MLRGAPSHARGRLDGAPVPGAAGVTYRKLYDGYYLSVDGSMAWNAVLQGLYYERAGVPLKAGDRGEVLVLGAKLLHQSPVNSENTLYTHDGSMPVALLRTSDLVLGKQVGGWVTASANQRGEAIIMEIGFTLIPTGVVHVSESGVATTPSAPSIAVDPWVPATGNSGSSRPAPA